MGTSFCIQEFINRVLCVEIFLQIPEAMEITIEKKAGFKSAAFFLKSALKEAQAFFFKVLTRSASLDFFLLDLLV